MKILKNSGHWNTDLLWVWNRRAHFNPVYSLEGYDLYLQYTSEPLEGAPSYFYHSRGFRHFTRIHGYSWRQPKTPPNGIYFEPWYIYQTYLLDLYKFALLMSHMRGRLWIGLRLFFQLKKVKLETVKENQMIIGLNVVNITYLIYIKILQRVLKSPYLEVSLSIMDVTPPFSFFCELMQLMVSVLSFWKNREVNGSIIPLTHRDAFQKNTLNQQQLRNNVQGPDRDEGQTAPSTPSSLHPHRLCSRSSHHQTGLRQNIGRFWKYRICRSLLWIPCLNIWFLPRPRSLLCLCQSTAKGEGIHLISRLFFWKSSTVFK